jgi:hypothetical protein
MLCKVAARRKEPAFWPGWLRSACLFWLFATPHPGQAARLSHLVALTGEIQIVANTPITKPPVDIPNIHQQPFFWTVMMASLLGWVLGMVKGFEGSKDWLSKYWPSSPKPLLFAIDFLIFVVFGAYIGVGLYQPANFTAALGAGLAWPVGLGALVSKTGDSSKSSNATVNQKTIEDGKGS